MDQSYGTISIMKALQEHLDLAHNLNTTGAEVELDNPNPHPRARPHPRPIDLTVSILQISVFHHLKKVEMMIGDDSLERHQCARMLFYKLSSAALEKCKSMQKGDIVRLNCVTIRKNYMNTGTSTDLTCTTTSTDTSTSTIDRDDAKDDSDRAELKMKHSPEKLSTIMCDFYHSFQNPTEGSTFGKIASFNPLMDGGYTYNISMTELDQSLLTPQNKIDAVGAWFLERHRTSLHSLKVHTTGTGCHSRHLYQKRKIRELNAPYMLSDVLVRISQLVVDDSAMKRPNWNWNRQRQPNSTMFRAILMDGNDATNHDHDHETIPFYFDHLNPLSKRMKQYARTGETFLMRRVRTENHDASRQPYARCGGGGGNGGGLQMDMEIVLVPTIDTSIVAVSVSSPIPLGRGKRFRSSISNSFDVDLNQSMSESQSSMFEDDSCFHLPIVQNQVSEDRLRTITTNLLSIHFEDEHLHFHLDSDESCWPTLGNLLNVLSVVDESSGERSYKPATLTIRGVGNAVQVPPKVQVKADAEVMSTLCGSYDLRNRNAGGRNNSISLQTVLDLLKGLIVLEVPLKWNLVQKLEDGASSCLHVEDVFLPSLDF